ncbi:hypothetical protein ABPG72_018395 [Tetrahymena utriculariae]
MEKHLSLNELQQVFHKSSQKPNVYLQDYLSEYFDEKTLLDEFQSEQNIFYPTIKKFFSDIKIYDKNEQYDIYSQDIIKLKKKIVIEPFDWFEKLENNSQKIEKNSQQQTKKQLSNDIELNQKGQQKNKQSVKPNNLYQPLNQQQLQSIQRNGMFISQNEGEYPKVWQISEKFYASYEHMKKYFKQFDYQKFKEVWCTEESKIRIYKKTWKKFGLSFCYWNLRDGLQTVFYDIPFQLLNCMIGTPVTFKTNITLAIYFNKYLEPYFQKINQSQTNILSQQDFLDRINAFDIQAIMVDKIKKLKWNQIHFTLLKNLKIYLLIECVQEFFNQESDLKIKYHNQIKLAQDLFVCVLLFDYLTDKIKVCDTDISEVKSIVQDCQFFIQHYKIDAYKGYLSKFIKKVNNFSQDKLWIENYGSSLEFERNKYFWKIISRYQITKTYFKNVQINKVVNNILHGYLGFFVVFRKQNDLFPHKTLYQMFQEIKIKVKSNIQQKLNESQEQAEVYDDGGIFGDCCSRFPLCTYAFYYLCIYFLHGIVFVSVFLRIIGVIFIVLQLILLIILYAVFFLTLLLSYLLSVIIYDEANKSNLNIPYFFPLFSILILNPILGLLKIIFSFFKLFFYFFWFLAMKIRSMPKSLKNCLTFIIIKSFSQVPQRDSSYCYLKETQNYQKFDCRNESSYQLNQKPENCKIIIQNDPPKQIKLKYFTADQMKLFIDFELDQKYMEFLLSQLDLYTKQHQLETEVGLRKIFNYLPFSDEQIVTCMQTKLNNFQKQMKEIIELNYKNEFEISIDQDSTVIFEQDQLEELYKQIQQYLTFKQNQSPFQFENIWYQIKIDGDNSFQNLTEYFILKMLSKYLPKNSKQPLFFLLLQQSQFILSNPSSVQQINKYLNENFFQEKNLFTHQNLNLGGLLERVKSQVNLSKKN